MSSAPRSRYLSVAEYLTLERGTPLRHEYIDGRMVAMAGASEAHNHIASNINFALQTRLRSRGCVVYQSDMRVHSRLNDRDHFAYPDVMVRCGEPAFFDAERDTLTNPLLIVEVLSPSTERFDRGVKFDRYRAIDSLREYVLVSQHQHIVERFVRQENDTWLLHVVRGWEATLSLDILGDAIPLQAIYEGVHLLPITDDDEPDLAPSA
jgi:Uma2 family endonuclease